MGCVKRLVKYILVFIAIATVSAAPIPKSNEISKYKSIVESERGYIAALMGKGKVVNAFIANRILQAKRGDSIRLDYYIMSYEKKTYYFYNAIKTALAKGAKIEIISEAKNSSYEAYITKEIPAHRYRNQVEFFYGSKSAKHDGLVIGLLNEKKLDKNSFKLYQVDRAGDSTNSKAINHRKVALFDIGGKKEIIISTANILGSGEKRYQGAIVFDANHYKSQWKWWNKVLDTDICFAKYGSKKECRLGKGGYETNYEDNVTSYVIDKTERNVITEWLKKMKYSKGCSLNILMGHFGSSDVLTEMKRIAQEGCKVNLIYAKEYVKGSLSKYGEKNLNIIYNKKVHAKLITWNGKWADKGLKKYVWIGSLNATTKAVHDNDETMVRIEKESIFKAYINYFNLINSRNE